VCRLAVQETQIGFEDRADSVDEFTSTNSVEQKSPMEFSARAVTRTLSSLKT
jgi:hypothetical protein